MVTEENHHPNDESGNVHAADGIQEDMFQEIFTKATEVSEYSIF